jgi:hypothetical protein
MNNQLSEHSEQALFFDSVLWKYKTDPTFDSNLLFAVPNGALLGGNRSAVMAKLKREGFKNGVSDMLYLQPRGPYPYLAFEFKKQSRRGERDGGLSESQVEFLRAVSGAGGLAAVCYGSEEAEKVFADYMALPVKVIPPAPWNY